jgi:hypothetical protein
MTILDLSKATVFCGAISFVTYSFPIIAQIGAIGLMAVLWLGYLFNVIKGLRRT